MSVPMPSSRRYQLTLVLAARLFACGVMAILPSPAAAACVGDCDAGGTVTVDELVQGVNIALATTPLIECLPFDGNHDEQVTVDELVQAVGFALNNCPAVSTPTPSETAIAPFTSTPTESPTESPVPSATVTPLPTQTQTAVPPTNTPTIAAAARFCDLPGSVQNSGAGVVVVPGGPAGVRDLTFMDLPVGFCAHFYAKIGNPRQLRFSPNGDLFVASPTMGSTGGGPGGRASVLIIPDDDHDGNGDAPTTFLNPVPATQGMLFTDGYFYYQDGQRIMRLPYSPGDRTPAAPGEQVAKIDMYYSSLHWPKPMDVADDGTIYVGNGGDQDERCTPARPFHGGIFALDGSVGGLPVAKGFRNPISVRCARGHNLCYAIELARDYTAGIGGREKLVPIRQGGDWGFPCCATANKPFPDISPAPNCSNVVEEAGAFYIGNTPFDLDFEPGKWPEPWRNRVFVPLHGAYGTWQGARVVAMALDPITGEVLPGSDLSGSSMGSMMDFITGWDDSTLSHGRPANVAFAADGRLFLSSDTVGEIYWIAPLDLTMPQP
jgi:glucose/arabinose dehydrogenase